MNSAFSSVAFRSFLFLLLVAPGFVRAGEPPKPLPLAKKVARASHIFIGTPSRVSIRFKSPFYSVDMTVKVDQALLPQGWNEGRIIHMHLALDLLKNQAAELAMLMDKQQLFLLMQPWFDPNGKRSPDFTGSGDYNQIAVPIAERAHVEEELMKQPSKAKGS